MSKGEVTWDESFALFTTFVSWQIGRQNTHMAYWASRIDVTCPIDITNIMDPFCNINNSKGVKEKKCTSKYKKI